MWSLRLHDEGTFSECVCIRRNVGIHAGRQRRRNDKIML